MRELKGREKPAGAEDYLFSVSSTEFKFSDDSYPRYLYVQSQPPREIKPADPVAGSFYDSGEVENNEKGQTALAMQIETIRVSIVYPLPAIRLRQIH